MRPHCAFNRSLFSLATNVRCTVGRHEFHSGVRRLNRFDPAFSFSFLNNLSCLIGPTAFTNSAGLSVSANVTNRCHFDPCSKIEVLLGRGAVSKAGCRQNTLTSCDTACLDISTRCLFSLSALLRNCASSHG